MRTSRMLLPRSGCATGTILTAQYCRGTINDHVHDHDPWHSDHRHWHSDLWHNMAVLCLSVQHFLTTHDSCHVWPDWRVGTGWLCHYSCCQLHRGQAPHQQLT